jgi:hypothetical protein
VKALPTIWAASLVVRVFGVWIKDLEAVVGEAPRLYRGRASESVYEFLVLCGAGGMNEAFECMEE